MMHLSRRPRWVAFTLIELLVVIAIIGVLIGLLLPAIQKVREAAMRAQCISNMKQLGIACQNYHDTNGQFQRGYVLKTSTSAPINGRENNGTFIAILPYVEQGNIYQNWKWQPFNFATNAGPLTNPGGSTMVVKTYQCPTQSGSPSWPYEIISATAYLALTSYTGNAGTRAYNACTSNCTAAQEPGDGIFFKDSMVNIASILDGTSNTILFGERSYKESGPCTSNGSIPWNITDWGGWGVTNGTNNGLGDNGGSSWVPINFTCAAAADSARRLNAWGSLHPGGACFAFTDGSARFLATNTDLVTLQALSTRAGSEAVTLP